LLTEIKGIDSEAYFQQQRCYASSVKYRHQLSSIPFGSWASMHAVIMTLSSVFHCIKPFLPTEPLVAAPKYAAKLKGVQKHLKLWIYLHTHTHTRTIVYIHHSL